MNTLEVLTAARALIARGWTREAYARDAAGQKVSPWSETAVCWCVRGAIGLARGDMEGAQTPAESALAMALGDGYPGLTYPLVRWNDATGRTQADVLAAFDKAIAAQVPA